MSEKVHKINKMEKSRMDIEAIKELGQHVSVLYLEDEEIIRRQMEDILKSLFRSVTSAPNGQIGMALFKKGGYDLVITDIQMPIKTGLDVAKEVKAISPNTPVIVVTAYSDASLFMSSIETGVDRYILKPINVPNLYNSLKSVLEAMDNKRKAEELHRKMLLEEINEAATDIIQKIANSFPLPAVAFSKGVLKFANEAFGKLFGEEEVVALRDGKRRFEEFFEQKEGYLPSPKDADKEDYQNNKAILNIGGKKQIVLVGKQSFRMFKEKIVIYTISNITRIEYQKLKNEIYSEILAEILFCRSKKALPAEQRDELQPKTKDTSTQKEPNYLYLSEEEKELLRKNRSVKYSAAQYTKELSDELLEEMEELGELEREWKEAVAEFEESGDWERISKAAAIIHSYAHTIRGLIEFEDLSFALDSLSKVLQEMPKDEGYKSLIVLYLDSIRMDLQEWRDKIFIQKSASDIHYLDSSLFSSCIQLQLKLGGQNSEDGDDLELF